jgi:prepilin-type N-terminal cleavage/methylation domain-containing protein
MYWRLNLFKTHNIFETTNQRRAKASRQKTGFSLIELLVVIGILGLIAAMGVPSLRTHVPATRLNSEARHLATFLRQARLKAANTQKPIRVSINCMDHFTIADSPACIALMETAIFADGIMTGWSILREGRLILHDLIHVGARDKDWLKVQGSSLHENLIWLVFMPTSQITSSFGPPINLTLWHGDNPEDAMAWAVTLNPASGRVTVSNRNS